MSLFIIFNFPHFRSCFGLPAAPTFVKKKEMENSGINAEEVAQAAIGNLPQEEEGQFDKLKYFIDLAKWFITSVAIVLITLIIDTGFRDRAAGMQEIAQYDKYVTDLIVLNTDPVSKRNLSQFFAYVTPSGKLKKGWKEYYAAVSIEYEAATRPAKGLDSTLRVQQAQLLSKPLTTQADSIKLADINKTLMQTQAIINPEIIVPGSQGGQPWVVAEQKGFQALLARNVDEAIAAFTDSERLKPSYHMVYEIGRYLKANKASLNNSNSPSWIATYRWILNQASWGMPADVKEAMKSTTQ